MLRFGIGERALTRYAMAFLVFQSSIPHFQIAPSPARTASKLNIPPILGIAIRMARMNTPTVRDTNFFSTNAGLNLSKSSLPPSHATTILVTKATTSTKKITRAKMAKMPNQIVIDVSPSSVSALKSIPPRIIAARTIKRAKKNPP